MPKQPILASHYKDGTAFYLRSRGHVVATKAKARAVARGLRERNRGLTYRIAKRGKRFAVFIRLA